MPASTSLPVEQEQYPWWSGLFNQFDGDGVGIMLIHDADERHHRAPTGWELDEVFRVEPCEEPCEDTATGLPVTCVLGAAEAFRYRWAR